MLSISASETSQKMTVAVLSTCLALFATVNAQTTDDEFPGKITCYGFEGREFKNNTQCPGSHICCQTSDGCDPNRFCRGNGQIIVPACSTYPWDNCANICKYGKAFLVTKMCNMQFGLRKQLDPGTGFLPRAVECDDGSFCCDNDPRCCTENRGIVLNGLRAIVTTNPGLTSTSTTASATSTTADAAATTTTQSTTSESQAHEDTLSTGAKAGIGIGAVAVFALLLIAFLLIRRRKRKATGDPSVQTPVTTPAWLANPKMGQEFFVSSNEQQYGSPAPS